MQPCFGQSQTPHLTALTLRTGMQHTHTSMHARAYAVSMTYSGWVVDQIYVEQADTLKLMDLCMGTFAYVCITIRLLHQRT
jgi:hypothetical protein